MENLFENSKIKLNSEQLNKVFGGKQKYEETRKSVEVDKSGPNELGCTDIVYNVYDDSSKFIAQCESWTCPE